MNTFLLYMIKSAFYMAAFYLFYALLLSKDTHYRRNRVFILISVLSAFLLPLVTIITNEPVNIFFGKTLTEILITGAGSNKLASTAENTISASQRLLLLIYLTGLVLFGCKLLVDILRLVILVIRNREGNRDVVRFDRLNTAGFSALGLVFVNSALSETDAEEVRKHEQKHLEHHHFLDIILIEIFRALQWFNPFIHFFNQSLREVHEFQADEGCLRTGIPVISYQRLIMNQVFRSEAFTVTNSFSNPTLIKKRMIMMTKERSRMLANLKLLLVLPVIAVVMLAFSSCRGKANSTETEAKEVAPPPPPPPPPPVSTGGSQEEPLTSVDIMPSFPGGDQALLTFIAENTKYPENAKEKAIQGRVVVRYAIETDGTVDKISVVEGVDPELDAEAIRVIQMLPKYEKPGMQNGKPVAVWMMVPITFKLK